MNKSKKPVIIHGSLILFFILLIISVWQLDIFNWEKLDISKITNVGIKTILFDNNNLPVLTLGSSPNSDYIFIDELPDYVPMAFIAAEDARFYSHNGIDIKRIAGALASNIRSGSYSQGASTITQQLIKLTHLTSEKTLSRKAQEAYLSLQLERKLTKKQILEAYLNTVYFGGGAYGLSAASQRYFSKPACELSISEAALLAGIIKSPSNYAPHINIKAATNRREYVIESMVKCGYLDTQTAQTILSTPLVLDETLPNEGFSWYTDQACLDACNILDITLEELISSGYAIYTSLDQEIQAAAEEVMSLEYIYPEEEAQGAVTVIRPSNGEICAMVGGKEYNGQYEFNRTNSRRQPGSLIKPISTYAAAIENYGFMPVSTVYDIQREYSNGYKPGNAGGKYYGAVSLRFALSKSLNAATVDLAETIGISEIKNMLEAFEIHPDTSDNNLALSLGAMTYGVSVTEMCAAYATLANKGQYTEPHIIREIKDRYGNTIYSFKPDTRQAISEESAYIITDILKTAASSGTAKSLAAIDIPVAGKTGTAGLANGDTSDVWAAAYTPDIAVTVWIGKDSNYEGGMTSSVSGSGYAVPACTEFFLRIQSKLSGNDFVMPNSLCRLLIDNYVLENNNRVLLAAKNTPALFTSYELFTKDAQLQRSDIWDAPTSVVDLAATCKAGEFPVITFSGTDPNAEYIILRKCRGTTETLCTVDCEFGDSISFTDKTADISQINIYTVIPRHKLLYEHGVILTGPESAPAEYIPEGLLNDIIVPDKNNTVQPDTETIHTPLF